MTALRLTWRLQRAEIRFVAALSAQEGEILMSQLYEESAAEEPHPAEMPKQIMYGVAADRYPDVLLRESAVLAVATFLLGFVAVFVVRRRRPE